MKFTDVHIVQLIEPLLERERLRLCGVRISGVERKPRIQVYLDQEESNITIDTCVAVTRALQDLIDMQDWVPDDYQLTVSSPGLDYPLREQWQFRKNRGRWINWDERGVKMGGRIEAVTDSGTVRIATDEGVVERSMEELSGGHVMPDIARCRRKR